MTPAQKLLVQSSFALLESASENTAAEFYKRLFELDAGLRPLFKTDMSEQGRKLMQMIGVVVYGLDCFDEVIPLVQALGSRHIGYGVKDQDYETVSNAFLWTLQKRLDTAFTEEVKEAWIAAFTTVTTLMKTA